MRTSAEKTLVVDNGAYSIKAGYSQAAAPKIFPNAIMKAKNERKRIFISSQIEECKDLSSLYYALPFQKGYLVNWDVQHQVWDYVFGKDGLKVDFDETRLILTEPMFDFGSVSDSLDEVIFEEYQFHSALRANAPTLSAFQYTSERPESRCVLIVDSGYSFTHIVPYSKGRLLKEAVVRINVGGKLLTNHLKEITSYRQLHVMDETYVMNQCKEDACYVSLDFNGDLALAKQRPPTNTILREYVLPDFSEIDKGYMRNPMTKDDGKAQLDEQLIRMNQERFMVPELLFHPSDVDLKEIGIPEAICYCVNKCPPATRPYLFNSICLTGGSSRFQGFEERVFADVRSSVSDELDVRTYRPPNPDAYAWQGGVSLSKQPLFDEMLVTKAEYEEYGHAICKSKFNI